MFSAPTAVRVLKKQDPALLKKYDLSSLRALFLAGEPLDEPTARWISEGLNVPIIDNYWQTESGWPILAIANGVEKKPSKFGSPGIPMYGYNVKLLHEATGEELTVPGEKGVVVLEGPTPPGFMQTIWKDDERFVNTYWKSIPGKLVYSTFDWGIRDADGYYFILGRTDDVINVAGHRLGTREIEESISGHAQVAEVAVVGVADALKGQVAMAFAVLKDASVLPGSSEALTIEAEIMKRVDNDLGRGGSTGAGSLCIGLAQDAQRQAAAPRHPGGLRRAGRRRPDHDGRSRSPAADQGPDRGCLMKNTAQHRGARPNCVNNHEIPRLSSIYGHCLLFNQEHVMTSRQT